MTVHQHSMRHFSAVLTSRALAGKMRSKDVHAQAEASLRPLFALTLPASLAFVLLPALLMFAPGLPIQGAIADLLARLSIGGLASLVGLGTAAGLVRPNIGSSVPIRIRRTLRAEEGLR